MPLGAFKMSYSRLLLATSLALLAACASRQKRTTGESSFGAINQPKREVEKVTEFDLNHDQFPDVWSFNVEDKGPDGKPVMRLVRKELDINWDRKVDITRFYEDKDAVSREAMDLDFDGKVDQVNFYEKGLIVRKERDLDSNNQPDLWIYFEKGKIARKERDSNADAKVDYWEYWEADAVDRIGEDLNGDGVVDRWTKSPVPTP
jgi:hypothetical protein